MSTRSVSLLVHAAAGLALLAATAPVGRALQANPTYAIRGARIFTASGAPIENGTVVISNGLIQEVGAGVAVPAGAIVIDGTGHNVYPGLIDMNNAAPIDTGAAPAAAAGRGGGGGRGGGANPDEQFANREDAERAKRAVILRPDYRAAEHLQASSPAQIQLASAGVTTVLAVPATGIFKGQSALVNVLVAADAPQISAVADYRVGLAVIKAPVASHIDMAGRGGGQGYPESLLGTIAFTKQGLLDAAWQRDAVAAYARSGGRGARPLAEPSLDALAPVIARQLPVAIDADAPHEIDRALDLAAEFKLDPIIVGGRGAAERTAALLAAKARVILALGAAGGEAGRGGGRGGGEQPSLRVLRQRAEAPGVPAKLVQAGVPFAFASGGQEPADFVRSVGRVIREGGLSADAALRAVTIDAARIAGAADRTGSVEKGKIANLVVTEGDLFDNGRVRHVFIDGRAVDIPPAAGAAAGRGGRGVRGVK